MLNIRRALKLVAATLAAALLVFAVPTLFFRPWSINHFYLRTLFQLVWQSPMICSSLHLLDFRKGELDDFSREKMAHLKKLTAGDLATLHGYDREKMNPEDPRAARPSQKGARSEVRSARLPRRDPGIRRAAHAAARPRGDAVDQ